MEAKAFFATDKQLREIMRRTKDRPNALQVRPPKTLTKP